MKLFIRNMVCLRCKNVVRAELEKLGFYDIQVELGKVETNADLSSQMLEQLSVALQHAGLELIAEGKDSLVERIIHVIVQVLDYKEGLLKKKYSVYISEQLAYNYTYLSKIFTEVKGITIEQFIINRKVDMVKQLIVYDELNLTEIANELQYSSVAHLSSQFKKTTGLTPTQFKQLKNNRNLVLKNVGMM